ncbi:uncharacterized protein LOC114540684 [Dendronephthya gigantea]|uniref:uncharacterized protein LOC114540684 n=1 Tax=Dendronephthya gigantea TaxID=151771 RepID=UPI00106BC575|nr:uncharacterized protein LOC114540684 [Dendronephthya gigantea]
MLGDIHSIETELGTSTRYITTTTNGDKYFEIKEICEVIGMLDITTSDVKASDWQDVWFEYTAKQRGNGLLWRVVILREEFLSDTRKYVNTLMFKFNHSSIDGVSTVKFCKLFLNTMNELANATSSVDQEIPSLDLLPQFHEIVTRHRIWHSLYNLLLTYCGLRQILKVLMKKIITRQRGKKPNNPYHKQFPPNPEVSKLSVPCRLNIKVFSEKQSSDIIQTCKANNCTVTGAITAAAHLAFSRLMEHGNPKDTEIDFSFPINALRFCDPKPDKDYLRYFVYMQNGCYMNYAPDDDGEFWKLAKETTEEIKSYVKKERYITEETVVSGVMEPIEIISPFITGKLIPKCPCNLISSMGSFNIGGQQNVTYKLNECFINDLIHDATCTFSHYIYTINGKMTWEIVSNVTVDDEHAEIFANHCYDKLTELTSSSGPDKSEEEI